MTHQVPLRVRQEKAMLAAAKANYKGVFPDVDPLVQQLGAILADDAGFLLDTCKRAGIHRQTLRKWLRGDRTPNLLDFKAILQVAGYSLIIRKDTQ
jgi:hypothetical protein